MPLAGPYMHQIDPVLASIFGAHLWWYGVSYGLGFLIILSYLQRDRHRLGLSEREVYDLTILVGVSAIIGGRAVQVLVYEWPFYSQHPWLIPAFWLGGMAMHGLLLGAVVGAALFSVFHAMSFFIVTDALAAPAAFLLAAGRIGNFIDGQIVGSVTGVSWAVKFPDAAGFRHPVVLYEGLKNLLLVPPLLVLRARGLPAGTTTGLFLFLYAFPRMVIDLFHDYPSTLLALTSTGQALNGVCSLLGLLLLVRPSTPHSPRRSPRRWAAWLVRSTIRPTTLGWRPGALLALALFALALPSDWTQDVPARYGKRHAGLRHSWVYPPIDRYRAELGETSARAHAVSLTRIAVDPERRAGKRIPAP